MRTSLLLMAIAVVGVALAHAADYADIAGLVYKYDGGVLGAKPTPAEGVGLELYKRSAESGWEFFDDISSLPEDGYYCFENVKMTESGGLCENADWFKVEVVDTTLAGNKVRYAHKQPRDGLVRVDVIVCAQWNHPTPPSESPEEFYEMGQFGCYDDEGEVILPDWSTGKTGIAQCPAGSGENEVYLAG